MSTKLVIFGERPGPNTDPRRPLYPHTTTGAAANLIRMMGITEERYLSKDIVRYNVVNDRMNLVTHPRIRERVAQLIRSHRKWNPHVRILVLGRAAAEGLPQPYRKLPFNTPQEDVLVIPHPSGRNRYYNSLSNKELTTQVLRKFVENLFGD